MEIESSNVGEKGIYNFYHGTITTDSVSYLHRVASALIDVSIVLTLAILLPDQVKFIAAPIFVFGFAALECSSLQASPGKLLLQLRVVDSSGLRLTFVRSLGRSWCRQFVLCFTTGFGLFLLFLSKENRALHDLMSQTRVVKKGNTT